MNVHNDCWIGIWALICSISLLRSMQVIETLYECQTYMLQALVFRKLNCCIFFLTAQLLLWRAMFLCQILGIPVALKSAVYLQSIQLTVVPRSRMLSIPMLMFADARWQCSLRLRSQKAAKKGFSTNKSSTQAQRSLAQAVAMPSRVWSSWGSRAHVYTVSQTSPMSNICKRST